MSLDRGDIQRLWINAKDSIIHALDHFSMLAHGKGNHWHEKWIILSVHHAADYFLRMLLKDVDPNDSQRYFSDPSKVYLGKTRYVLLKYKDSGKLKSWELKLLDLVGSLNQQRIDIAHRDPSDHLDPTTAAWSILAILRAASRRFDIAPEEIFDQYPPIQREVVEAIHWRHLDEYSAFIEAVLAEEHPETRFFELCPYCGTHAIYGSRCEGCFEEVSSESCASCGADFYVPSDRQAFPDEDYNCPECGAKPSE